MRTAAVLERDALTFGQIESALEAEEIRTLRATSVEEALDRIERDAPDLLILDANSGGMAILERRHGTARSVPAIMLAAAMPDGECFRAWQLGVDAFVSKRGKALDQLAPELRLFARRILERPTRSAAPTFGCRGPT